MLPNRARRRASIADAAGLWIGLDDVGHVFAPYFVPPETMINTARCQDVLCSYYPWDESVLRCWRFLPTGRGLISHSAYHLCYACVAFALALLPPAATSLLLCVEVLELDGHSKTDLPQSMTWAVPLKVSTSPDTTRFKAHRLFQLVLSLSTRQKMCRLIPWLTHATNCTWHVVIPSMNNTSRSSHTPRHHVYALHQSVATYQFDLYV